MTRAGVRVGDVFAIPLSGGRKAYGRYYYRDAKQGPIIEVFEKISGDELDISDINFNVRMFRPLIAGVFVAVREGLWRVIGRKPIENFAYPGFLKAHYGGDPARAAAWFLWNGSNYVALGDRLPLQYHGYEYLAGWAPGDVVRRIETGYYPSHLAELFAWEAAQQHG